MMVECYMCAIRKLIIKKNNNCFFTIVEHPQQALRDVQIKGVCVHLTILRHITKGVLCFIPQVPPCLKTMAGFCGVGQVRWLLGNLRPNWSPLFRKASTTEVFLFHTGRCFGGFFGSDAIAISCR